MTRIVFFALFLLGLIVGIDGLYWLLHAGHSSVMAQAIHNTRGQSFHFLVRPHPLAGAPSAPLPPAPNPADTSSDQIIHLIEAVTGLIGALTMLVKAFRGA